MPREKKPMVYDLRWVDIALNRTPAERKRNAIVMVEVSRHKALELIERMARALNAPGVLTVEFMVDGQLRRVKDDD